MHIWQNDVRLAESLAAAQHILHVSLNLVTIRLLSWAEKKKVDLKNWKWFTHLGNNNQTNSGWKWATQQLAWMDRKPAEPPWWGDSYNWDFRILQTACSVSSPTQKNHVLNGGECWNSSPASIAISQKHRVTEMWIHRSLIAVYLSNRVTAEREKTGKE